MITFHNTASAVVAAVREADALEWALGDALLKECGTPDHGEALLIEAAAEVIRIRGHYLDLTSPKKVVNAFRKRWLTAHRFPPATRRADVGWEAHCEAQTPAFLADILDVVAKRGGHPKKLGTLSEWIGEMRRTCELHGEGRWPAPRDRAT